MMDMRRIRVLVVDDHPTVRCALCHLVACYPDMQVAGMAQDGRGALEAAKHLSPDVMLLDVSLPGLSGIQVARRLCHSSPPIRIIMLASCDVECVARIVEGTAHGCLLKSDAANTLAQAIRAVYRGERWVPPPNTSTCAQPSD